MSTAPFDQTTNSVLMVRPWSFFSNPETAATNKFQLTDHDASVTPKAQDEFDVVVQTLRDHGVHVVAVNDTPEPSTPDAVFPNNWLSTHADGTVITYPMLPVNRRPERREDLIDALETTHEFRIERRLDLTGLESDGHFLEGTGSMVLDRVHRRAYACFSPRTHDTVLQRFCQEMDFEPVGFGASGSDGTAVYHTNVMMCVGSSFIVVCLDSVAQADRPRLERALHAAHDVLPISMAQMNAFAGNMLELKDADGEPLVAMSRAAHDALGAQLRARLSAYGRLLALPIPTIESAGGSVRCMLAELFLEKQEEKVK